MLRIVIWYFRVLRRDLVPLHFIGREKAHIHLHFGVIAAAKKTGKLAALYPEPARVAAEDRRVHRRLIKKFENCARVRFHAFQGLYLFVTWLLVDWVIGPAFRMAFWQPFHNGFAGLLKVVVFGTWIFMIIKTSHDQMYKLPILGDLAEKSVSEQR